LTDNVTSQLSKIRDSIAGLGGGKAGVGMERMKRQTTDLSMKLKDLSAAFSGGSHEAIIAAKSMGLVTLGIGAAGVAVTGALRGLSEYTTKMQDLGKLGKQIGIDPANIKKMQDAFRLAGVDAGTAVANIRGIAGAMADLGRRNSQLRQDLMKGLQGKDLAVMNDLIESLKKAPGDIAAFGEKIKVAAENVFQNNLAATKNPALAAEARQNFLNRLGVPNIAEVTAALEGASDAYKAMIGRRIVESNEYNKTTAEISVAWEKISESVKALATPAATAALIPIANALTVSAEQIESAVETIRNFQPPEWLSNLGKGIAAGGQKAADVLNTVNAASAAAGESTRGALGRGVDWLKNTTKGANAARAEGGPVDAGGTYLVGEQGPEVFKPKTAGSIIPNSVLQKMTQHVGTFGLKGVLQRAKKDAEEGHPLRTRLRAMLGLHDPGEPAPWQAGGQWAARASGGPVSGGSSYLVGEAGPELFAPSGSGGGSDEGKRLLAEQTHQVRELNANTEGQSAQMKALTDQLAELNRNLEGPGGGGGGSGGAGAGGGGRPRMGGLGGLPGGSAFGGGGRGRGGGGGSSGGGGASGSWESSTATPSGADSAPSMAPPGGGGEPPADMANGIRWAANELGISASDLATTISYETAGTMNPNKTGPTTQWGQHKGLIQWGKPQAKKYLNNDFSIPSQMKGIVQYMKDTGVKPGMGMENVYAAVNAGNALKVNASDANNGGAPGTVRDKVRNQMRDHRRKADALLAANPPSAGGMAPSMAGGGTAAEINRVNEQQGNARWRPQPIAPELKRQINEAAKVADVIANVTSGGQHGKGSGGKRKGSDRHDYGNAADLHLTDPKTGRKLDMRDPADQARMATFMQESVAQGATGVGAAMGYMGANTMHIGGGKSASWGGVSGERAPGWVADAHARGTQERNSRAMLDRDMDRGMAQTVKGEGKLTVDVSAPAGTRVGAEGSGLFKTVETNRQVQMAKASEGPSIGA
jgi:hypothetical protein